MALVWIQYLLVFLVAYAFGSELTCPTLFNYYPDQHDCTKFYRCVWGKATLFNCPAGTRWSQAILTCDHTANVPCTKQPATKTVYDKYTGNYQKTYDPERKAPDFSVDYEKKGGYTTNYPDKGYKKNTEPMPYYPDYTTHPKQKEVSTQMPYYPDYQTYPKNKNDYTGDYFKKISTQMPYYSDYETYPKNENDNTGNYVKKYQPGEEYVNVDYRRFYPTLGYYYASYYPLSSYPYNYQTSTEYYDGYPDLSYNPYYKISFNGPYTPHGGSKDYSDSYYEKQYKPAPSWFPHSYVYQQSRNYPDIYYMDKYERRPEQKERWPSSDLFRAGYGYKRIYVKK